MTATHVGREVEKCRGRGSNPHAPCGAQDFKVFTPAPRKLLICL